MISASQSQTTCKNPVKIDQQKKIQGLLQQIMHQKNVLESSLIKKVKQDRKMYHSYSAKTSRNSIIQNRPFFNNKTKQGQLIDMEFKPIPYVFIPAFKNDTFIMPNRVFQKGQAGKRFCIKMKDTSLFSFRQSEGEKVNEVLHKKEKQQTIISRQNEQFNRIINQNNGKRKAETMKLLLKTRRRFNPVHASDFFDEFDPMLEPKDAETKETRKISLSKTYDYRNKWRPATRGPQMFSATASVASYTHQHYASSVR